MPITKDAYLRYRVLDKCFRNPVGRYTIQKLIDKCNDALSFKEKGISLRTIRMDIAYMRSEEGWNAPIETFRDNGAVYYRYSDPDFSIEKMPVTEAQLKYIQSAVDVLNMVDGLPEFEGLGDSLAKIGMMVYDTGVNPCFGLDHNEYVEGREFITPLFNAIQYKTVMRIRYKPFDEEEKELIYHPHFLKQYNNRWYIFGVEQEHIDEIWNLALDRIISAEATTLPYKELDVDWREYFTDIIGVTNYKEAPVEEVRFLVHGRTIHYLMTKPIHESQRNHWIDENTLEVKLYVKINYELKRLLLSYAADITLLSPEPLVEEHKETLQKALIKYS